MGAGNGHVFNHAINAGGQAALHNVRMVNNVADTLIRVGGFTAIDNALFAGNAGRVIHNFGEVAVVNATFLANGEDIYAVDQFTSSVTNSVFTPTSAIDFTDSNYTGDPSGVFQGGGGLLSPVVSYDADRFQTTLTDDSVSWTPGAFAGLLLDAIDLSDPSAFDPLPIIDNTATSVRVWGTPSESMLYLIRDLRPNGAPLADSANDAAAPCADLLGAARVDLPAVAGSGTADIGAYEQDGNAGSGCAVQCRHECTLAGGSECTGGWSRDCVVGSDGCRAWTAWSLCATEACEDAVACSSPVSCTDECPGAGQTSCQAGQVTTCQTGGDGCLDWSGPSACASGSCQDATACATPQLGVCDRSHVYQCYEYTDPAWTEGSARAQCESDGVWTTSCPAGTVVGRCIDSGSPPYETTIWHYEGTPVTVEQLTTACTATGGTWQ